MTKLNETPKDKVYKICHDIGEQQVEILIEQKAKFSPDEIGYAKMWLEEQKHVHSVLKTAEEANEIARKSKAEAKKANKISFGALIISAIALAYSYFFK